MTAAVKRRRGNAGIYEIRNCLTGGAYIGQSHDMRGRFWRHKSELRRNRSGNIHLQRAWNKYGEAVFGFAELAVFSAPWSREELAEMEQDYVDFFSPSYNIRRICTTSQLGTTRHAMSAETRAKLSAALKGRPVSDERRKRISATLTGRKMSPEAHAKLLVSLAGNQRAKGFKHSPETRAKVSASLIGNKRTLGYRQSDETRAKISAAGRERRHTQEEKDRISRANKGVPKSAEHRAKISIARKAYENERRRQTLEGNRT